MAQFQAGHKKKAGRKKGIPNKSTQDIQQIIRETVDFPALIARLAERAHEGNERAATILFEYGFGKPTQTINATISTPDRAGSKRALDEIFGGGQGVAVSPSGSLVAGQEPVQDSEQGPPDGVQHVDSTRGNGKRGVPG